MLFLTIPLGFVTTSVTAIISPSTVPMNRDRNTMYNVCSAASNNCEPGTPSSCIKKSIIVSPPAIQYLVLQDTLLPCPPQDHRQ